MTLKVPMKESVLIENLSELNPMEFWVKPLILAKMLVFSSEVAVGPIKTTFDYTKWISENLDKLEARIYIDRLKETHRAIEDGTAYLHVGITPRNLSKQDDLKKAEDLFNHAQELAKNYRKKSSSSARDLFLPIRARAFCLKGQVEFYRGKMDEACDNFATAEGILDDFDHPGSFGPITDVRAFSLSAAASRAVIAGEDIGLTLTNTHRRVIDIIQNNDMGNPRWPTKLGFWLREVNLNWPHSIPNPKRYIPQLNMCIHLRILAKFESNWAYYQASIGHLDETVNSAHWAARLMVEAYFGQNANDVLTNRDLNWYLTQQQERIVDVQNTGARAMLWAVASAVRNGSDYTQELNIIAKLKLRDGDSTTVSESLTRGIDNLRKIGLDIEAEEITKKLANDLSIE